jgi:hypothetical protein
LEFLTLSENGDSRVYNFIRIDDKKQLVIHHQLENRNGRIFMRAKKRPIEEKYL